MKDRSAAFLSNFNYLAPTLEELKRLHLKHFLSCLFYFIYISCNLLILRFSNIFIFLQNRLLAATNTQAQKTSQKTLFFINSTMMKKARQMMMMIVIFVLS